MQIIKAILAVVFGSLAVLLTIAVIVELGGKLRSIWIERKHKQLPIGQVVHNKPYFNKPRTKVMHNPFDNTWRWTVLNPLTHVWDWKREATPEEVAEWFMSNDDYAIKYGLPISDVEQYDEPEIVITTIAMIEPKRHQHQFVDGDVIAKCAICQGRREDDLHIQEQHQ